jgi:hypothetical protein
MQARGVFYRAPRGTAEDRRSFEISPAPEPQASTIIHRRIVAESLPDAAIRLECGEPLPDREAAEYLLTEIEVTTGKRHYIFELEI